MALTASGSEAVTRFGKVDSPKRPEHIEKKIDFRAAEENLTKSFEKQPEYAKQYFSMFIAAR